MRSLSEVARELYGVTPGEFVAARTARAREAADAGDKELAARIRKLAKPPVAAWAVNALVRHRPEEVTPLLELGERMREASAALDRDALREGGRDRQRMLAGIAHSARDLGEELGVLVSAAAADDVQRTFQAAIADAAASSALATGLLIRPLSADGLDPADLAGAVALPAWGTPLLPAPATPEHEIAPDSAPERSTARSASRRDSEAARRAEAERQAEVAQDEAEQAAADLAGLELEERELRTLRERLLDEQRTLRERLEALADELDDTTTRAAALRRERLAASRASDAAARAATRARARLR